MVKRRRRPVVLPIGLNPFVLFAFIGVHLRTD
jgi:hypothetical protein